MNQGFKLRFDQMRESDPTSTDPEAGADTNEYYPSSGHTRNICLVWPDGRRMFFNYAYLIAAEFEPESEKNRVKLSFSSHKIVLEGYGLDTLFMALLDHVPRLITAIDPRYVLEEDKTEAIVIQMSVETKDT